MQNIKCSEEKSCGRQCINWGGLVEVAGEKYHERQCQPKELPAGSWSLSHPSCGEIHVVQGWIELQV